MKTKMKNKQKHPTPLKFGMGLRYDKARQVHSEQMGFTLIYGCGMHKDLARRALAMLSYEQIF